ncbi:MAG: cobalamin-dependent protein [Magnetococcales bacterium]|nr:cobalamin-dependent protein [Magnetococcales bacterium]
MNASGALDLLVVTPPTRLEVYQGLSGKFSALETPVWAGLIADFVRRNGYTVQMLDAETEGLTHEQTAQRIAETDAKLTLYAIFGQQPSASTQCMPGGRKVALMANKLTDRPSLVTGPHPSSLPARTLREEPYTYVCQGEGPYTVLGLLDHLHGKCALKDIPGLWYAEDDTVHYNKSAPLIEDLSATLPAQAWDLLDMTRYRAHNWQALDQLDNRQHYASVQTSLGCPYHCSFCCINAPFTRPGIRFWNPDTVIAQIDTLVEKYGVKIIKIPDEMFVLNRDHVLGICDRLIERNYDLNIWAYARVDTIKPDFLDKLRRAGIVWMAVGVESASKFVRDGVDKGRFGDADIKRVLQMVRDNGLYTIANYIFGLPDDDHDSMRRTLDLALDLNAEWANFYATMAYPGSALHPLAAEKGWPLPEDPGGPGWIGYSQHAYDTMPLPTDHISAIEVLKFRDQAFDEYFGAAPFQSLIKDQFGTDAVGHIQDMLKGRLSRRHHDEPDYYDRLVARRKAATGRS